MAGNPNFPTDILASTLQKYSPAVADAVKDKNVILRLLDEHGFTEKATAGYRKFNYPISIGEHSTITSFDGLDKIPLERANTLTASEWYWSFVVGTLLISEVEEWMNSNGGEWVPLIKYSLNTLKRDFQRDVGEMLLGDGTGNDGKDLLGLQALVEEGSAYSTVGGIDSSVVTEWQNQWIDFQAYGGYGYTSVFDKVNANLDAYALEHVMSAMKSAVTQNNDQIGLILTDEDTYLWLEQILNHRSRVNIESSSKMISMGFDSYNWKNIPVTWDKNVPAGYMWFLVPEHLRWRVAKDRNFSVDERRNLANQLGDFIPMYLFGQLFTTNRKRQGLITNIPSS